MGRSGRAGDEVGRLEIPYSPSRTRGSPGAAVICHKATPPCLGEGFEKTNSWFSLGAVLSQPISINGTTVRTHLEIFQYSGES